MNSIKQWLLISSLLLALPAFAKPIPDGPYYKDEEHREYQHQKEDFLWEIPTLEIFNIDGVDHPYSEAVKQRVIGMVQTSEACQLDYIRDRLYVNCFTQRKDYQRSRFGQEFAQYFEQIQDRDSADSNDDTQGPEPLLIAPEDEDLMPWLNEFDAADAQALVNVMSSIFDGGFKDDNRAATEALNKIGENLNLRISDLQVRKTELDEVLTKRKPVVDAQYRQMEQRYISNVVTFQLQDNHHRQLIVNTQQTIEQRIDDALPAQLATTIPDIPDLSNRNSGAAKVPFDYPGSNVAQDTSSTARLNYETSRERAYQSVDFANSRTRLRDNLANNTPDPVFEFEAELDLVELYANQKLTLAERLLKGEDRRAGALDAKRLNEIVEGLLSDARSARYFATGLMGGVSQSVVEAGEDFVNLPSTIGALIDNYDVIAESLWNSAVNYEETGEAVYNYMKREWGAYQAADEKLKGQIIGKLLGNVLLEIGIPGVGAGTIKRIGKLGELGKLQKTMTAMDGTVMTAATRVRRHHTAISSINSADPELALRFAGYRTSLLTNYHSIDLAGPNLTDAEIMLSVEKAGAKIKQIEGAYTTLRTKNRVITPGSYDFLSTKAINHTDLEVQHGLDELVDNGYFDRVAMEYSRLEVNLRLLDANPMTVDVKRAIPKTAHLPDGGTIPLTPADVFKEHFGMFSANHRYSYNGQHGMYTVMTDAPDETVMATLKAELGMTNIDDYFIDKQSVALEKVLDLTVQDTLDTLGIDDIAKITQRYDWNSPDLTDAQKVKLKQQAYELTHQIGHAASRANHDAIIFPSAAYPDGKGLVILKPKIDQI